MKIINGLIFLSCLYSMTVHAEEKEPIKWECKGSQNTNETCNIYVLENGTRHIITTLPPKWMGNTHINYYSKNLAEIKTNYEHENHGSFFYELSTKKESKGYELIYLVDPTHNLAVVGDAEGVVLTSIIEQTNPVKQILVPRDEISWNSTHPPLNRVQVSFQNNKIIIVYLDRNELSRTRIFGLKDFSPIHAQS